jgi:hypothetical protein
MKPRAMSFSAELRRRMEFLHRQSCHGVSGRLGAAGEGPSPHALASEWRRSWSFADEKAARDWNADWDAVLGERGCVPAAFLTTGGAPIADRCFDMAARMVGSVLAEQVHAGMPCPYVEIGWRYEVVARFSYLRVSQVRAQSGLEVAVTTHSFGTDGALRWSTDGVREFASEQVPDAVSLLLASQRWMPLDEAWGRG